MSDIRDSSSSLWNKTIVRVWEVGFPSAPPLDKLLADEVKAAADTARLKYFSKLGFGRGLGKGGRRSRKKNNRNKKRVKVKTLNKKKYRLSRTRRFLCKNKK
jgi:hypothetical protein